MVSVKTPCIYCVKAYLSKTKHHMAALGGAAHCTNRTNGKSALKLREENFVFLPSSRLWQTISSSLSLILDCFVKLRGEGLDSSRCRHVSVCLSAVWSEHAFLVAWQLLWAPNNASPANKCTQLTIHETSYRHIVQSVRSASKHHKSHVHSLSFSRLSSSLIPSIFLPSPSSLLQLRGAHLGWRKGRQAFWCARWSWQRTNIGKRALWQSSQLGVKNCLSSPTSRICLLYSTWSASNLPSTGCDDVGQRQVLRRQNAWMSKRKCWGAVSKW